MLFKRRAKIVLGLVVVALLFVLAFALSWSFPMVYKKVSGDGDFNIAKNVWKAAHVKTPSSVKAIYMTSCAASTKSFRERVGKILDEKEINSLVIDIKDYSGGISFKFDDKVLAESVSKRCTVSDLRDYIESLHKKGVYVIGRITVFQDPVYSIHHSGEAVQKKSDKTVWEDGKGLSYVDPGGPFFWNYIITLAKASYELGFDEINFDYVRFPSDGNMSDIFFPLSQGKDKSVVIESFFRNLHENLKDSGMIMSADLFGMTTTNTDDLNIGQVMEKALPYFDYLCPMVYPSHYPAKFNGWTNPNLYPYEVVKYSLDKALPRVVATSTPVQTIGSLYVASTTPRLYTKPYFSIQKIRPWLQDFQYGGTYGPKEVRAQIRAVYDSGLTSFMLWDPANKYTMDALLDKTATSSKSI